MNIFNSIIRRFKNELELRVKPIKLYELLDSIYYVTHTFQRLANNHEYKYDNSILFYYDYPDCTITVNIPDGSELKFSISKLDTKHYVDNNGYSFWISKDKQNLFSGVATANTVDKIVIYDTEKVSTSTVLNTVDYVVFLLTNCKAKAKTLNEELKQEKEYTENIRKELERTF